MAPAVAAAVVAAAIVVAAVVVPREGDTAAVTGDSLSHLLAGRLTKYKLPRMYKVRVGRFCGCMCFSPTYTLTHTHSFTLSFTLSFTHSLTLSLLHSLTTTNHLIPSACLVTHCDVQIVDHIPRNAMGKVNKKQLVTLFA
mgnify:CR=1 FL=1